MTQKTSFIDVPWQNEMFLCFGGDELVEFNVPLDTYQVISETSLSSQSLGYGTDKTNLQQPR